MTDTPTTPPPEGTPEPRVITTSTGTTIRLAHLDDLVLVVCDNPAAPPDYRNREVGRVEDGGFQSVPFATFGLRPEALRAIADLIEENER